MTAIIFTETQCGYSITATLTLIGSDLLITLTGGNHPHIGSVSTYSRDNKQQIVRFPSHSGRYHKDDLLSDILYKSLDAIPHLNCVITSGIHVDGITQEQIEASLEMTKRLGQAIAQYLIDHPIPEYDPVYKNKH